MCREMARQRLHDQHSHTEVEKGLARVRQSSIYTAYTVLRMCRDWLAWKSSIYTVYTVLRMCKEMAGKRLHDQHPHTEVEKRLARVG